MHVWQSAWQVVEFTPAWFPTRVVEAPPPNFVVLLFKTSIRISATMSAITITITIHIAWLIPFFFIKNHTGMRKVPSIIFIERSRRKNASRMMRSKMMSASTQPIVALIGTSIPLRMQIFGRVYLNTRAHIAIMAKEKRKALANELLYETIIIVIIGIVAIYVASKIINGV